MVVVLCMYTIGELYLPRELETHSLACRLTTEAAVVYS
jgi:hypothetical protein